MQHHCDPAAKLCRDCLRVWLDRPPTPPEPEADLRDWVELEQERVDVRLRN